MNSVYSAISAIKPWNRATIADGIWLNKNDIQPIVSALSGLDDNDSILSGDFVSMIETESAARSSQDSSLETQIINLSKRNVYMGGNGMYESSANLPITGSGVYIYLVGPVSQTGGDDYYEEYIWNGTSYVMIGDSDVDLEPINANIKQISGNLNNVSGTVYANSGNWNSTYNTLLTNSSKYNNSYIALTANSGNWNSTYNTVNNNSSKYESNYNTVFNNSSKWGETVSTLDPYIKIFNSAASNPEVGVYSNLAAPYNEGNAFGTNTLGAFTQGHSNSAIGNFSNAQGQGTISYAEASHSEGGETQASGFGSHAEGLNTNTLSQFSHAEGYLTMTSGVESHTEGASTSAFGPMSHAEGCLTFSNAQCSHSEGVNTSATGNYSHSEGQGTLASGNNSHAEGGSTKALNEGNHAEGGSTSAIGNYSHAEGQGSISIGDYSHAEGGSTSAIGNVSHTEGLNTSALVQGSHAEGYLTKTSGYESHAEGHETLTLGSNSHAEGYLTTAFGNDSHAEGGATESYGIQSHSEGQHTTVYGNYSHAEGFYTTANAEYSHAEGRYTNTNFKYETVVGNSNSADELFGPTNAFPYFQVGVGNYNQANGLSVCSDSNTYIPINGMQTPLNSYAQRTLDIQLYMLTTGKPAVNYSYYSKNGLEVGNATFTQGSSISLSNIASKLTSWNGVDNIIARRSTDITESTAPLGLNIKTDDGFLDPFIPISLTVFPTINTTASAHPITINFTNSIASAWLVAIYAKSYAGTHTGTTAANIWTREFNGTSTTDYKIINFMTNIASADGGGTKILYINGLYNYL